MDKTSGGSVTQTRTYYPAAGAMRIGSTLYYVLKDHLGSASVVTDASGVTVGEDRFYPYGETRFTTGTMYTDKLFTGQREITGLGIYHYGARFYSPKLGRFLSADTLVPGAGNPQAFNRYSYVLNNPLKYTDPSGHCPEEMPSCIASLASTSPYMQHLVTPAPSHSPSPEDDDGGGDPVISSVPPGPACIVTGNSCVNLNPDISQYFPTLYLHPSDLNAAHGHLPMGTVPIYSSDGKIIGYKIVYYELESASFNDKASGQISDWNGVKLSVLAAALNQGSKKLLGFAICPWCGEIATAVTLGDLTNQSVTYTFSPQESVVMLPPTSVQEVDMIYHFEPVRP